MLITSAGRAIPYALGWTTPGQHRYRRLSPLLADTELAQVDNTWAILLAA